MRNRKGQMLKSEIMTILLCYHFGSFRNFKHYYLFFIKEHLASYFPKSVSHTRFVELMPRVFFDLMAFMRIQGFGKCIGISFVDSTMIPVCHNMRRKFNKVFDGLAKNGKGTMGWCPGFKLHLLCNEMGDVLTFCLTSRKRRRQRSYGVEGLHQSTLRQSFCRQGVQQARIL